MGRRAVPWTVRKEVSVRIQRLIDTDPRFGTFYAFRKWVREQGHAALASTVTKWLPPQTRWKKKPDGAAVRSTDWKAITLPDPATLMEFCDLLNVRADYLLFGEGAPYREQSRTNEVLEAALEADVAARVTRELPPELAAAAGWWSADLDLSGEAIIRAAVTRTVDEIHAWRDYLETIVGAIVRAAARDAAFAAAWPLLADGDRDRMVDEWAETVVEDAQRVSRGPLGVGDALPRDEAVHIVKRLLRAVGTGEIPDGSVVAYAAIAREIFEAQMARP